MLTLSSGAAGAAATLPLPQALTHGSHPPITTTTIATATTGATAVVADPPLATEPTVSALPESLGKGPRGARAPASASRGSSASSGSSSSSRVYVLHSTPYGGESTALIATTATATPPIDSLSISAAPQQASDALSGVMHHHHHGPAVATSASPAITDAETLGAATSSAALVPRGNDQLGNSANSPAAVSGSDQSVGYTGVTPVTALKPPSPARFQSHGTLHEGHQTTITSASLATANGGREEGRPEERAAEDDDTTFLTLNLDDNELPGSGRTTGSASETDSQDSATVRGDVVLLRPESVPEDLVCAICLNIACDPTVTECGHVFCRRCITAAARTKPECPLDRQPIVDTQSGLRSDVRARRQIRRLQCACPAILTREQQQRILGVTITVPAKAVTPTAKRTHQQQRQGSEETTATTTTTQTTATEVESSIPPFTTTATATTLETTESLSRTQPSAPISTASASSQSPSTGEAPAAVMLCSSNTTTVAITTATRATSDARHVGRSGSSPSAVNYPALGPCHWTGSVSDAAEHLRVCAHYAIPCPYAVHGCKAIVPRGLMDLHMREARDAHIRFLERALDASQCQCAVLRQEVEVMRTRCCGGLSQVLARPGTSLASSSSHVPRTRQAAAMPVFAPSSVATAGTVAASGTALSQRHHVATGAAVPFSVTGIHQPPPSQQQHHVTASHSPMYAYRSMSTAESPLYSAGTGAAAAAAAASLSTSAPTLLLSPATHANGSATVAATAAGGGNGRLASPGSTLLARTPSASTSAFTFAIPGVTAAAADDGGAADSVVYPAFPGPASVDVAPPVQAIASYSVAVAAPPPAMITNSVTGDAINTGASLFIWALPNFLDQCKRTSYSRTFTAFGLRWCMGIDYHGRQSSNGSGGSTTTTTATTTTTTTTTTAPTDTTTTASAAATSSSPSPIASSTVGGSTTASTAATAALPGATGPGSPSGGSNAARRGSLSAYSGLYLFAQGHQQRVPFRLYLFNSDPSRDLVHTVEDWSESYRGKGWGPVRFIDRRTVAEKGFICGARRCLRVGVEVIGPPY